LLSFTAIFLFRKRKIQLKLTFFLIIMTIIFIGIILYYIIWVTGKYQAEIIIGYRMFIPFVMLILEILAFKGIKNDENLVKSYDRLR
jgi:hypothetical protein